MNDKNLCDFYFIAKLLFTDKDCVIFLRQIKRKINHIN